MKIGKYFTDREFFVKQDDEYQQMITRNVKPRWYVSTVLVKVLDIIREHFDAQVVLTSAWRTAGHNLAVGGKSGSLHMSGMAADIIVKGVSPLDVFKFCRTIPEINGLGLGVDFVHVDVRNDSRRYEWPYGEVKLPKEE